MTTTRMMMFVWMQMFMCVYRQFCISCTVQGKDDSRMARQLQTIWLVHPCQSCDACWLYVVANYTEFAESDYDIFAAFYSAFVVFYYGQNYLLHKVVDVWDDAGTGTHNSGQ